MSSRWIPDDSSRNIGCYQNITVLSYIYVVSIDQFVETNLLFVIRSPKFASNHPPCDTASSRTDADLVLMPDSLTGTRLAGYRSADAYQLVWRSVKLSVVSGFIFFFANGKEEEADQAVVLVSFVILCIYIAR